MVDCPVLESRAAELETGKELLIKQGIVPLRQTTNVLSTWLGAHETASVKRISTSNTKNLLSGSTLARMSLVSDKVLATPQHVNVLGI